MQTSARRLARFGVAALLGVASSSLGAQNIRGVVRDSASRQPVAGAVVMLLDSVSAMLARNITSEQGQYQFYVPATTRRLRVVRIGFRPREFTIAAPAGGTVDLDVVMVAIPTILDPVVSTSAANCPRRSDQANTAALLSQARAGLLATVVAREAHPASLMRLTVDRIMDGTSDRIRRQAVRHDSSASGTTSFSAVFSAPDFLRQGFMVRDSVGPGQTFLGPDADVLLDDRFAAGYCFRIVRGDKDRPRQIGLGFAAANQRPGRVDIDGVLWIDSVARTLVDIEFRYVGLDPSVERYRPDGQVGFVALPNGVVMIDRWHLSMAETFFDTLSQQANGRATVRLRKDMHETGGELAHAAWPGGDSWQAPLATLRIRAVAHDGTPATGTPIILANTDFRTWVNADGSAEFTGIPPGPYALHVADARLAALGLTIATPITFTAVRDSTIQRELDVPTALDYVRARCVADRRSAAGDSTWLLVRFMTPQGQPAAAAPWTLRTGSGAGLVPTSDASGTTGPDGVVALCNGHFVPGQRLSLQMIWRGVETVAVVEALEPALTVRRVEVTVRPRD
jgi:hypothetical protein